MQGKLVWNKEKNIPLAYYNEVIDVSNFSSGFYVIKIIVSDKVIENKIVVN